MNAFNEYLENLDRKNLVMLYLSVVILFFILGYFIFENILLPQKQQLINKKISLIKKIKKIKFNNDSVIILKKQYKKEKLKINSLQEDLNYLNSLIYSSPEIYINQKRYLDIINKYLELGSTLNASFEFNQTNKLNKYNVHITGYFLPDKYFVFVKFIKLLQKPKAIITINDLELNYNSKVDYDINLSIWSIK